MGTEASGTAALAVGASSVAGGRRAASLILLRVDLRERRPAAGREVRQGAIETGGAKGPDHGDAKDGDAEHSGDAGDGVVDAGIGSCSMWSSPTEFMTSVVSGATVTAMPNPRIAMSGKKKPIQ